MAGTKTLVALLVVLLVANSEIIPFDNNAIEKIFQQKSPALFLFTSDNDASTAAKAAFTEFDEAGSPVILTLSDANDGHGLFERLAEYLGVDTKNTPAVLFMGDKNDKYNFDGEEINKDTLASFVTRVQNGEVEQFLKSAPIPETNDEPVKIAVGKTFKSMILDSDKEFLVKFYAPWCGHCKNLAPHYDEAAKLLAKNPNIILVKVDSTLNEVANVEIQGFPTLKFWGKDKSVAPIDYTGGRNTEGIISWLKEHTEYDWVDVEAGSEENTDL